MIAIVIAAHNSDHFHQKIRHLRPVNPFLKLPYIYCKICLSNYLAANKNLSMKQFSIVLNIVLIIAVAFLYYLHFAGAKKVS